MAKHQPKTIGEVSFWYADMGLPQTRRPALAADTAADVAIIGAGYTGLWAAYYLKRAQPDLDVVIIDKHFAGYGASGRNGGWCMGAFAWNHDRYAKDTSRAAVLDMVAALEGTVAEITRICADLGIDADIHPTQEVMVATSPAQLARMRGEIAHRHHWGEGHRLRELTAAELAQRISIPNVLGAMAVSGVARIQPAKLVRGLAVAVETMGVRIYEDTAALSYAKGQIITPAARICAPVILRCTEGFTATLKGHRRDWLPLNSAQIATAPLPPEVWAQIGWEGGELIGDMDNAYCYCQRTRDGRITVGARGVPYRFGSKIDKDGAPDAETIRRLTTILHRHFPAAKDYPIDHAWCGVLGVPRDWCATVGLDPSTGLGWAGGYVGVGVSTANLAGQTLADLAQVQLGLAAADKADRPAMGKPPPPQVGERAFSLSGRASDVSPFCMGRCARSAPWHRALAPCPTWQLADRSGLKYHGRQGARLGLWPPAMARDLARLAPRRGGGG
ncbi:MAG: FAD-dependent oxidoreductase [Cypionkella sp.]|nr:FAD-dependent oxidoreductase [Cypionkella sp.]